MICPPFVRLAIMCLGVRVVTVPHQACRSVLEYQWLIIIDFLYPYLHAIREFTFDFDALICKGVDVDCAADDLVARVSNFNVQFIEPGGSWETPLHDVYSCACGESPGERDEYWRIGLFKKICASQGIQFFKKQRQVALQACWNCACLVVKRELPFGWRSKYIRGFI